MSAHVAQFKSHKRQQLNQWVIQKVWGKIFCVNILTIIINDLQPSLPLTTILQFWCTIMTYWIKNCTKTCYFSPIIQWLLIGSFKSTEKQNLVQKYPAEHNSKT